MNPHLLSTCLFSHVLSSPFAYPGFISFLYIVNGYHFPNSVTSSHIPMPLTWTEVSGVVTVLWEVLRVTQQMKVGIVNTPFNRCPWESFSRSFSCSHFLQNSLVSLPKSLPYCSLYMPSCFVSVSCYCFPEIPAALHGWEQCFEVSLSLWLSPFISLCPDSRNPVVILSSHRIAQSKWAAAFGI